MSEKKIKLRVKINPDGDVKVSVIPEEVKSKIPRPGDSIFIISSYPEVDSEDVDGIEILEEDIKVKPILGYSYTAVMVKASVLNDEMDEVLVNGEYKIPLYKNSGDPEKKLITFTNEEKAQDKFRTLMNISITETKRRKSLYDNIQSNLEESLEKLYH